MTTDQQVEALVADADALILEALEKQPTPGLAVAIVHGGDVVYRKGFGVADVATGRPITPDTGFRIGSVTKTFTALAVMRLVEQGLVDLDAPASRYLEAFPLQGPDGAPPITVRHLLTHRSGIGEILGWSDLWRKGGRLWWKPDGTMPRPPEFYRDGVRAEVPPETKWAYANHGFSVLGQIVEDVTGVHLEDHLRDTIFDPLGMAHTELMRGDRMEGRLAEGYKVPKKGAPKAVDYREIITPAAGSIFSTLDDMSEYARALLGGGANRHGRVVDAETLKRMYESQWAPDPRLTFQQGLGFMIGDIGGHRIVHHGGAWPGFISMMMIAPDDDLAVLAFTNGIQMVPLPVCEGLLRRVFDVPDPLDALPVPGVREPVEVFPELEGAYAPRPGLKTNSRFVQSFMGQLDVVVRHGHLHVRGLVGPTAKGIRLYAASADDPYVYIGKREARGLRVPIRVAFHPDGQGGVERIDLDAVLPNQVYPREPRRDVRRWFRGAAGVATLGLATGVGALRRRRHRRVGGGS